MNIHMNNEYWIIVLNLGKISLISVYSSAYLFVNALAHFIMKLRQVLAFLRCSLRMHTTAAH